MSSLIEILLVDDDREALESLSRALLSQSYFTCIETACDTSSALTAFRKYQPACVVLDLSLSRALGVEAGYQLLRELLGRDPTCRVIVLTGHSEVGYGIRAMELGAAHFLAKPADLHHLSALIRDSLAQAALRRSHAASQRGLSSDLQQELSAYSPAMQSVLEGLRYASETAQSVLLTGETGTGKGVCAAILHRRSTRSSGNFIRYQSHLGSADLVNSDLFGHRRGAFTGACTDRKGLIAEAHTGTFFLDEIDSLPIETQVALLGVLQEKRFRSLGSNVEQYADFRLITASNQDLARSIEEGRFRRDLFHRIAHCRIHIPALRERREDLPILVASILRKLRDRGAALPVEIDASALSKLCAYGWPGNIRELEAVLESAAYRAQSQLRSLISAADIKIESSSQLYSNAGLKERTHKFQYQVVNEVLQKLNGNQLQAARELGVDRGTVRRIIERS